METKLEKRRLGRERKKAKATWRMSEDGPATPKSRSLGAHQKELVTHVPIGD